MNLNVVQELRKRPVHEAARLIGVAPKYITDSNFINLLNQYDLNKKKDQKRDPDMTLIAQFNMFSGVPGLKEQVGSWLNA
jgi:hypothetical protein